jgi:hypothetical protein
VAPVALDRLGARFGPKTRTNHRREGIEGKERNGRRNRRASFLARDGFVVFDRTARPSTRRFPLDRLPVSKDIAK